MSGGAENVGDDGIMGVTGQGPLWAGVGAVIVKLLIKPLFITCTQ